MTKLLCKDLVDGQGKGFMISHDGLIPLYRKYEDLANTDLADPINLNIMQGDKVVDLISVEFRANPCHSQKLTSKE